MTTFVGIDPGVSGGIAALRDGVMACWKMPDTEADIYQLFDLLRDDRDCHAFVEHVHSMPQDGVRSAFTFGCNYGALRMALTAAGIPWEPVPPSTWLREMKLKKQKGETETSWKNRHKAMAQRMWPSVTVTHAVADAMLLAECCRRSREMGVRV